jgi:micrococcal nuclease
MGEQLARKHHLYTYRSRPTRSSDHHLGVVDGDTLDLTLDLGLRNHTVQRLRLNGVDTAEIFGVARGTREYEAGHQQRLWVMDWLQEAVDAHDGEWPLLVQTTKDTNGKYGRLLADVQRLSDGASLTADLQERFPDVADP